MRLILDDPGRVAGWVADKIPAVGERGFGDPGLYAIGVLSKDGTLGAGIVFHGWRPQYADVEVSQAITDKRCITRDVIRALLHYPFNVLKCQRITAHAPSRLQGSVSFMERTGFCREGLKRRGFGDDDCIVMGLLRDDWLNGPYGLISG